MKPLRTSATIVILLTIGFIVLNLSGHISAAQAQQVQVTAADPSATAQGTINLNVKVTGKGFKNGAKAKWFVTRTTDPGGVTVNSTAFVSSTEVTANITVADTAVIATFDIQVLNSDGRGGKGTELFAVTGKGQTSCPELQPAPTSDTKCYAALPGCLDSTFGGVGYVHISPGPSAYTVQANAVVVQSDGKIVVAGTAKISSTYTDFAIIRYNVDGTLDNSFGDPDPSNPPLRRGYAVTAITTGSDTPNAVVLQPDGKIVVSGSANGSVAVRYNPDGSLDTGFGSGGIVNLGISAPNRDLTLQSNGKIIIGGSGGGNLFALVRLNTNGSLDSSFGSGGLVTANPSGAKRGVNNGWSLAIQRVPAITGEERIVLVGSSNSGGSQDWTLMRFRSSGAKDTTFGSSGILKTYFSGFGDQARRVRIDSSNRIVVAGSISLNNNCGSYVSDFAVVRYTQDGSLDGSFAGGKQIVDIYGGSDTLSGLVLQMDGKIFIAGTGRAGDNSVTHLALVRFNPDGSRDSSFGLLGNGVVTTDLYGTESWGMGGVALDSANGRIVVAGGAYLGLNFTQGEIVVARYLP